MSDDDVSLWHAACEARRWGLDSSEDPSSCGNPPGQQGFDEESEEYHYQEEETPAFPLSAAESTSTTNPALISKQLYGDGYYGGCDHETSLLNPLPFDYGIHSSLKSCSPERATERFFGVRQFSQHQAAYHRGGDSSTEDIADDIIRLFASSP